jgi:dienelactone hydrolase
MDHARAVQEVNAIAGFYRFEQGSGLAQAVKAAVMKRVTASPVFRLANLYRLQTEIIFPGSQSQGKPEADVDRDYLVNLTTADGTRISAMWKPAVDSINKPTVLFFYGNNMCMAASTELFERFSRLGVNVMVPEFVGFGLSDGRPGESACYATADAAFRWLQNRPEIDPTRIVATGVSLGGAVAIDLASRNTLAGLVTLVTFTSLPDMARRLQPGLPIWRFMKHKFESVRKMAAIKCPALIAHSREDSYVPMEMADQLAAAAGGPVTRLTLESGSHDATQMMTINGERIFAAIAAFLGRV